MMSFLNPPVTIPPVFLFPPCFRKNKYMPSLIRVCVKHSSKRDGEGLFEDKRLLNVPSCSGSGVMSPHHLSYSGHAFALTISLSLPLTLQVPTPSPPRLSSISPCHPLSLSVTRPLISFKGEGGRHLFLGYLPISMMAARLIIRGSFLAFSASSLANWHHSFTLLLLLFHGTLFSAQALLLCSSLGNDYLAVVQVLFREQACILHAWTCTYIRTKKVAVLPVGSIRNHRGSFQFLFLTLFIHKA